MFILPMLIEGLVLYTLLLNISKIKFNKIEAILFILSVVTVIFVAFSVIAVASISALMGNVGNIIILAILSYRKVKIISLSILYGMLTIIIFLLSGNLTGAILGFIMMPLFGAVGREIVLNSIVLMIVYPIIAFSLAFLISYMSGKFMHNNMHDFDDVLKNRLAKYMLIAAAIILTIFLITTFLHEILASYALLTLVYALALSICFGFMVFAIFAFINSISKEAKLRHKDEMIRNIQEYAAAVEDMASEMRRFRHDHVNMNLTLFDYIKNNNITEISKYFDSYMPEFEEASKAMDSYLDTLKGIKTSEVKSLLSAKLMHAHHLGINIHIEVSEDIEIVGISNLIDLCRIIGIYTDNAIDACRNVKGAKLQVMVSNKDEDNSIVFVFKNTCTSQPDIARLDQKGYSTKGGSGLGLYTASKLIERSDTLFPHTVVEGGYFIQELTVFPGE